MNIKNIYWFSKTRFSKFLGLHLELADNIQYAELLEEQTSSEITHKQNIAMLKLFTSF